MTTSDDTKASGDLLTRLERLREVAAPLEPDAAARRALTELVTDHVGSFLEAVPTAATFRPPGTAASRLAAYGLPDAPRDPAEVLDAVGRLVEAPGVATTSPRYLGYIPSGGLYQSALADLVAGTSNRYAGLASVSPGAAALESLVVRWLADAVGLGPGALGTLTSGGSAATLTAVVVARDAAGLPTGTADVAPPPVVYLGEHTHHSVDVALHVAGLGGAVVRRVPSDERNRMAPAALARAVRADRAAGLRPFLLVATAGATSTGAVDPLAALADVARAEDLWLHVDAAYGGLFALCPEGAEVLDGIGRADSVVVDPHKTLFLPYGTGAVLVREGALLRRAFTVDADYLAPAPRDADPSPADLGPELTRHFRALRLWLPLQLAGTRAFAAALSEKVLLARHAHARLAAEPTLEVGPPPDLAVTTVACRAGDDVTAAVARELQDSGEVYLTTSRVRGRLRLRVAVGSFRTHVEDVDAAVDAVVRAVARRSYRATATPPAPRRAAARPSSTVRPGRGHLTLEFTVGAPDPAVRACELEVLADRYGDTAEDLEEAYGAYADDTVWLSVRDDSGVLGWARLIMPGALPQKTLADATQPPWSVDAFAAAASVGLDPRRTWDLTTIGVRRELGAGGARVAATLYHGTVRATRINGGDWVAAMVDVRVRALTTRLGMESHPLPGTRPEQYMGSPALAPVYSHLSTMVQRLRTGNPQGYRQIALGDIPGLIAPQPVAYILPAVSTTPEAGTTTVVDLTEAEGTTSALRP